MALGVDLRLIFTVTVYLAVASDSCILFPPKIVVFSGEEVSLTCTVCGERRALFWILDGQDSITLSQSDMNPRTEYLSVTSDEATSQLTFTATPERNHTVSCEVVYGDARLVDASETVKVPSRGMLSAPETQNMAVHKDMLTVSWTPLHSIVTINYNSLTDGEVVEDQIAQYTLIISGIVSRCRNQVFSLTVCEINPSDDSISVYETTTSINQQCAIKPVIVSSTPGGVTDSEINYKYMLVGMGTIVLVLVIVFTAVLMAAVLVHSRCLRNKVDTTGLQPLQLKLATDQGKNQTTHRSDTCSA